MYIYIVQNNTIIGIQSLKCSGFEVKVGRVLTKFMVSWGPNDPLIRT